MPKKMTKEDADQWIAENNLRDKYEILNWADKASVKSLFLDKVKDRTFECEFAIFKRNIQRNPDTTFGITQQEQIEKARQTAISKYGTEHYSQTEEYKNRVKQTSIEKFGETNVMKTEAGKSRQRQSLVSSYGVEFPLQNEEIKQKMLAKIKSRQNE